MRYERLLRRYLKGDESAAEPLHTYLKRHNYGSEWAETLYHLEEAQSSLWAEVASWFPQGVDFIPEWAEDDLWNALGLDRKLFGPLDPICAHRFHTQNRYNLDILELWGDIVSFSAGTALDNEYDCHYEGLRDTAVYLLEAGEPLPPWASPDESEPLGIAIDAGTWEDHLERDPLTTVYDNYLHNTVECLYENLYGDYEEWDGCLDEYPIFNTTEREHLMDVIWAFMDAHGPRSQPQENTLRFTRETNRHTPATGYAAQRSDTGHLRNVVWRTHTTVFAALPDGVAGHYYRPYPDLAAAHSAATELADAVIEAQSLEPVTAWYNS